MAQIEEQVRVANWMVFLIGIWLILAPFFTWYTEVASAMWSSIITGALLVVLSLVEALKPSFYLPVSSLYIVVGFWLVLSPLLAGFSDVLAATLVHFGMGIIVLALGIGSIIGMRTQA